MPLQNGDFEGGTCRDTFDGLVYPEIEVPAGWTAFWEEDASDPDPARWYYRPEMKVIHNEPPYLDPPRVFEGNQAVQWFGFYKKVAAGLMQTVALTPGHHYRFSVHVQAWYSQRDDPHLSEWEAADGDWRVLLDGDEGLEFWLGLDYAGRGDPFEPEVIWIGPFRYYEDFAPATMSFVALNPTATLFIMSRAQDPFKHCDSYIDDAQLEDITPPDECYGTPRVQYARVYNVYPVSATAERREAIAEICAGRQQTCGPSYDDAGIGDLSDKTAVLWDIPTADRQAFIDFFAQYYPGTVVTFEGGEPDPPEPPDPDWTPVRYVPQGAVLGWHTIGGGGQVDLAASLAQAGASLPTAKFVQHPSDAAALKAAAPHCRIVARYIDIAGQSVEGFNYSDDADPEAQAECRMGQLLPSILANPAVDFWEIANEQKPPYPSDFVKMARFYIRAMQIAEDAGTRLALFSQAVGNPEYSAWDAIADTGVFELAAANHHAISLHEYGRWSDNAPDLLTRFQYLYDNIILPRCLNIPLFITEYGCWREDIRNGIDLTAQFIAYEQACAAYPYVVGVHIYTNPYDADYATPYLSLMMTTYRDYVIAVKDRQNG